MMSILVAPLICADDCGPVNEELVGAKLAVAIFGHADAASAIAEERAPGAEKDHL
jgi:hypothetical protein